MRMSGPSRARGWVTLLSLVILAWAPLSASSVSARTGPPESVEAAAPAQGDRPWRAHEALGLDWFRFGLEHRSRIEHLENGIRLTDAPSATGLFMRTLLTAELRFSPIFLGVELADARAWTWEGTPLQNSLVNPVDLLQAYVRLQGASVFAEGDGASISVGRMTLDVGSRRLVARNEFRNTINAFTGVDAQWTSSAGDVVRAFAALPVLRLPADPAALAHNDVELDRENTEALLWAVIALSRPLSHSARFEVFVLGLHERDSSIAPSANRQLITPGLRMFRPPTSGALDVQVELIGQLGWSRASTLPTDRTDLAHRALSLHASTGFRFDVPWAPRPILQFDYASGDGSPDDQSNNRFDPLFGARRFELGPTGLFGAVARSNLSTPGLRLEVQPRRTVDAFIAHRWLWLASARDAWTTAALRDPTGGSGTFVGQQLEGRVRLHLVPRSIVFDLGAALLIRGAFAAQAGGGESAPSAYVYSQMTGTL